MDREKVMDALDCLSHGGGTYDCLKFPCPYGFYGYTDCHKWEIARDALALLKEQDAVKPVRDEQTGRMWLCGNCGAYVGFEDNDPYDPNEFDNYCARCGRPVLWEGRCENEVD